jgi:hypothetical protein
MRNCDNVTNGAGALKLGHNEGQNTEAALVDLRVQLGTITATVARLEWRDQKRQRLNRIAAILAAALTIWGAVGLVLLGWFF